ncbi:uncharacterized protein AMSG_02598 [Thecamonas trahens ATCC 50062]|uniref:Signal recognition particle 9 kDa protein n=1 Tax=Thecamonas trahens ATCC 50062 TaxID=461836 RepID=A0A0L0D8H0_THETB|nr:hypothetical protein AMSG_02598 [Thecamonas trahens ATCC 50062]KNC47573.1 hypothetical protein AMSG_02598 [Thecamonas trahens ATCC 50062]|eukprot:XP_013759505.1 hypothetical protein AMSG_02598 [Thecamonas trahens ATCC 50062]
MIVYDKFNEFYEAAEDMYHAAPSSTRYVLKHTKKDGEGAVELKVTDNVSVIKFRSSLTAHLKHVDRINTLFISLAMEKPEGVDAASSSRRRRKA